MVAKEKDNSILNHDNCNANDGNSGDEELTRGVANAGFVGDHEDGKGKKSVAGQGGGAPPHGKVKISIKEKWRILKNVAVVSLAFMVQFTAFQGTANLQSSINAKGGLGTVSLSAIYAALVLSCMFVPTFLIKRLTVKWTLCLSMLCYAPYVASQFYPEFYTLVPAGVLLGIGAAPMWASKATYLTEVGSVYAKITDQPVDAIIVRFFGFFFLAWQTAELWGNLISSLVLSSGTHPRPHFKHQDHYYVNGTLTEEALELCGANFCVFNNNGNDNLERPPDSEIYEISAIYMACIVIAVLIVALFVDPLSRYGENHRKGESGDMSGVKLLTATASQLKKPLQQLLIPITIWIGMEQAFIGADFTQAYISCALGISSVGYVMICFGVVNAWCSALFGSLMKYVGRFPIMTFGFVVHVSLIFVCLLWRPNADHAVLFFVVSGLWGVGDAVWQTQVNGIYGTLFRRNKEAAFSNYRLWESVGFVIAYAYSTQLCARMKLYVQLTVLCIGFLGYVITEILQKRRKKRQRKLQEERKVSLALEGPGAVKNDLTSEETDDEKDILDDEIVITHL